MVTTMGLEKWEWAWLAGLFEGEGSFSFGPRTSVQAKICMTDRDVVESVDRLIASPIGIQARAPSRGSWGSQTQWRWQISSRDDVRQFIEGIYPFLHSRRRARADEALERLARNPGSKKKRTHCPRGHPLSGDNLYIARTTGSRSCWTCRRMRDKERKRK